MTRGADWPKVSKSSFWCPTPKVIINSSWTMSPWTQGSSIGRGSYSSEWLMFNRLSNVNQPEILI